MTMKALVPIIFVLIVLSILLTRSLVNSGQGMGPGPGIGISYIAPDAVLFNTDTVTFNGDAAVTW